MGEIKEIKEIIKILEEAQQKKASDIHLASGKQVMFRIDGRLVRMSDEIIAPNTIEMILDFWLNQEQQKELEQAGELEFAYSILESHRVRVSVFRQSDTCAITIRMLYSEMVNAEKLGMPQSVIDLTAKKHGLVLIAGEAGSGKSTTLASLIHVIAEKYEKSIITLEDPIEYLQEQGKSMVLQREIGRDSRSYAEALRMALRQDADVIMVGRMQDAQTATAAMLAAQTGHLVFSSFDTNSVTATVDGIVNLFPLHQQIQIRLQLAGLLEGVVAQQLLPRQDLKGRVAAFEVMLPSAAICNLIREGKTSQLRSVIQTSFEEGMQLMDDAIYELYMKSYINSDTAVFYAGNSEEMREKVQLF